MNIEQGLFKLDFTDYHAILGVSIEADPKQVRKRYLRIARKLHPDTLASASSEARHRASELLSKLVNPAYEKLSDEKAANEYALLLKLKGRQLNNQMATIALETDAAQELARSKNLEFAYSEALKTLSGQQYDSLEQVFEIIGQISELNLVYLMRRAAATDTASPSTQPSTSSGAAMSSEAAASSSTPTTAPPPPRRHREVILESYLNRARTFEYKKDYARAILELREALQAHPTDAACHSHLASIYLKAGQPTMARVHVKRALDLNANDAVAQSVQQALVRAGHQSSSSKSQSNQKKQSRGGLFGLFGGGKN